MFRKAMLAAIVTLVAFNGVPFFSGSQAQAAAPVRKNPAQSKNTPTSQQHKHHHHRHHHKHHHRMMTSQVAKKHHHKKHHHKKHHRHHKKGSRAVAPMVAPNKLV